MGLEVTLTQAIEMAIEAYNRDGGLSGLSTGSRRP